MTIVAPLLNSETKALYYKRGLQVTPTSFTQGPWSPEAQHGGAPAALLAGELERRADEQSMSIVRLTFEFLQPVPISEMRMVVRTVRDGRRMHVYEARLMADGRVVVRASATALRRLEIDLPLVEAALPKPPTPDEGRPVRMVEDAGGFSNHAVEIRVTSGDFAHPGAAAGWFRLKVPVVDRTPASPIENVCAAADFGNGLSNWIPDRSWLFVNPDLTVYLARPPVGDWIHLDSRSSLHPVGTGMAESSLYDINGHFGRAIQSLLVEPVQETA